MSFSTKRAVTIAQISDAGTLGKTLLATVSLSAGAVIRTASGTDVDEIIPSSAGINLFTLATPAADGFVLVNTGGDASTQDFGVSFGPAAPADITTVNGIVTAAMAP